MACKLFLPGVWLGSVCATYTPQVCTQLSLSNIVWVLHICGTLFYQNAMQPFLIALKLHENGALQSSAADVQPIMESVQVFTTLNFLVLLWKELLLTHSRNFPPEWHARYHQHSMQCTWLWPPTMRWGQSHNTWKCCLIKWLCVSKVCGNCQWSLVKALLFLRVNQTIHFPC